MGKKKEFYEILMDMENMKPLEQVNYLQTPIIANDNAFKQFLKYALDPNIKFDLPEGKPPFKASEFDEPSLVRSELKMMNRFIVGSDRFIEHTFKREMKFIDILQFINENDANMLCMMKDKKLPIKLTKATVNKAFPGLI